jgi:hypothetical protein
LQTHTQLVDLIEQKDRVLGAGLTQPLNDATWHRAHVGATVTTNVGFVPRATQCNAHILAVEGACNRLRN